jgi:hypothetical protein
MFKDRILMVVIGIVFLFCSCNNELVTENNKDSNIDASGEFDPFEDEFEPLISIDSLNMIEEELNKKLEEFEQMDGVK